MFMALLCRLQQTLGARAHPPRQGHVGAWRRREVHSRPRPGQPRPPQLRQGSPGSPLSMPGNWRGRQRREPQKQGREAAAELPWFVVGLYLLITFWFFCNKHFY